MSKSNKSPVEAGTAITMALDESVLSLPEANYSIPAPPKLGERRVSSHFTEKEESQSKDHDFDWQNQTKQTCISKRKGRRKTDSIWSIMSQWIVEHQIGLAVNLLLLLFMTHICFPRARPHTRKFFTLSCYNPLSGKYTLGQEDLCMVTFWIVALTGLRAAVMDYVLAPIAQASGIKKQKERVRFTEQAWIFIYGTVIFSLGLSLMYNSSYWLNMRQLWAGWPNRELDGLFKWYYLVQIAFWVQQILVVNIEKRRKDHVQMFTHHIITCALMCTSYAYHQTKVGNLILCLMDVVDLFLALAKMLKYMKFRMACDIAFGVFLVVWFIARQVLYLLVCYSVYAHIPLEITYGCYWGSASNLQGPISPPDLFSHLFQPFRDPEGLICWDNKIKWAFLSVLIALQVILLIWFGMILRVAYKVLRGGEAEDSRSDDELEEGNDERGETDPHPPEKDEEEEEEEDMSNEHEKDVLAAAIEVLPRPLEEEVGVEAINLSSSIKSSSSRRFRKGGGTASGVTIPSDRKELLGRIGCDKGGSS